ncbi:MAG TPA: type 4a pilus biogenesis protein PilO [Syntrophomonadaceae bacterium]|nr:type 4a pilus biogenesis protein PilO [Syntrophomonadaceae bacterium]
MDLEKKRSQQTIISVVLGAAILACMIFLLYNQANALKEARFQVEQEESTLQKEEGRLLQLISLSKQAPELEERKARAEELIPAFPGESLLITGIQDLADKSKTDLLDVSFEKRVPKKGYDEMPIKLTFEGRYHGLLILLDNLQNWKRNVRVNEVKVSKGSEDLPQIKAEITAAAFYQEQGKEAQK